MRQNVKMTLEIVEGGLTADFDAWVRPTVTGTNRHWYSYTSSMDRACRQMASPSRSTFCKGCGRGESDLLIGLNAIDLHSVLHERHGEPGARSCEKHPLAGCVLDLF